MTSGSVTNNTDSTFLLLSSTANPDVNQTYSIPRPRSLPILLLAVALDLAWTTKTIILSQQSIEQVGETALLTLGILRPLVVLYVLSSRKVREKGWLELAQVMTTILVCLYHFNELQQRRPDDPISNDPTSNYTILRTTSLALNLILPPFTSSTQFIFTSLSFSFLHYLLYAIFIGIRRRHNPFVGNNNSTRAGSIGLPRTSSRTSWREEHWTGNFEEVGNESRTSLYVGEESEEGEVEEESGEDDEGDTSSDEDELIDIPKPSESLRNRSSRGTLRESVAREESSSRGSRIVSTNYGSFAGI